MGVVLLKLTMKYLVVLFVIATFASSGFAHLHCQVCGQDGSVGVCADVNDNGESKECPGETDVCLYSELHDGEKTEVQRRCEPKNIFGVHCKNENIGNVNSIVCTCNSDNCNKDDGCTCGGAGHATVSLMTLGLVLIVNKFMQ